MRFAADCERAASINGQCCNLWQQRFAERLKNAPAFFLLVSSVLQPLASAGYVFEIPLPEWDEYPKKKIPKEEGRGE